MGVLEFFHKAWLLHNYTPDGRWSTSAGMRNGDIRGIESPPKLWGVDRWMLDGGKAVSSREIFMMLDRGDFGY
ncbi:MAG: hypothetical protein P4M05_30930 [Bradyrhizobium sp.]|nr:hypothetical protein [Bradyrhizobium sp.]